MIELNEEQKKTVKKMRESNFSLEQIHAVGSLLISDLSAFVADEKFLWETADKDRRRIKELEKKLGIEK